MALTCGFFNSQNGDRKYSADQLSSLFDGLITDGVYDGIGELFAVTPASGMTVYIGTGRAWFNHTWSMNDTKTSVTIDTADAALARIDAVVLEINSSNSVRANSFKVVKGTPAATPAKPTLTNADELHQHALAYVTVPAGATSITISDIEVVVGKSETPFVTSIVQSTSIDALFQQWEGQFDTWLSHLKVELSGDVAANLQRQIDEKVNIADKATAAEVAAGTDDTKWVTPKGVRGSGADFPQIGDIKETTRTDLGDDWLLCNGGSFSADEYPELAKISALKRGASIGMLASGYSSGCYCVTNNGTLWVIGARNGYIHYTTDPSKSTSWTTVNTNIPVQINDIKYYDGLWVAVGHRDYGGYTSVIATTTDITNSIWALNYVPAHYLGRLCCYEGLWVAYEYGASILYYTTDPAGEWSISSLNVDLSSSSLSDWSASIYTVGYANGIWFALGRRARNSVSYLVVWYASSLDGEWSLWGNGVGSVGSAIVPMGFGYSEQTGTYAFAGYAYGNSSNYRYPYCCYTNDPAGTWTVQQISSNYTSSALDQNVILHYNQSNSRWYFIGEQVFMSNSNMPSAWTYKATIGSSYSYRSIRPSNSTICATGNTSSLAVSYSSALSATPSTYTVTFTSDYTGYLDMHYHQGKLVAIPGSGGIALVSNGADVYPYPYAISMTGAAIYAYNGVWVAVGGTSTTKPPYISVCSNLESSSPTWNAKTIGSNDVLYDVFCYNGLWVAVGYNNTYATTDPANATSWTALNRGGKSVFCYNGVWVIATDSRSVRVSTDPLVSWTTIPTPNVASSVYCYDGLWVAVGSNAVMYTTDPFTSWISNEYFALNDSVYYDFSKVFCYGGMWVVLSYASSSHDMVLCTTDPTGAWRITDSGSNSSYKFFSTSSPVLYNYDGRWICGDYFFNPATPIISSDGSYAYIKAKE